MAFVAMCSILVVVQVGWHNFFRSLVVVVHVVGKRCPQNGSNDFNAFKCPIERSHGQPYW